MQNIFQLSDTAEKPNHLVASRRRWLESQERDDVRQESGRNVKSIPPTTDNWLRKLYKYSKKNYKSTEDKQETNHINNKYNDTNMNTRKMHNT